MTNGKLVHSLHRHVDKPTNHKPPQFLPIHPPSSLFLRFWSLLWVGCPVKVTIKIAAQLLRSVQNLWHHRGAPTLQWRHDHREGQVRGMVTVRPLPPVFYQELPQGKHPLRCIILTSILLDKTKTCCRETSQQHEATKTMMAISTSK